MKIFVIEISILVYTPDLREYAQYQWPFEEAIDWRYQPYIRPVFKGYGSGDMIYPQNMAWKMVQYLH